jgi:hypothetical protein
MGHLRGRRAQADCAARAGIHRACWSLYEAGKRMPRDAARERIAVGLGVSRRHLEEEVQACLCARLQTDATRRQVSERVADPAARRELHRKVGDLATALEELLAYLLGLKRGSGAAAEESPP